MCVSIQARVVRCKYIQAMHVTHLEKHLPEDDNGNLYMVAPIQARGIESKME